MRWILWAAAVYNLTWGAGVILFPTLPFEWVGMEPPNYPSLWQCIGMIVGVFLIPKLCLGNHCLAGSVGWMRGRGLAAGRICPAV